MKRIRKKPSPWINRDIKREMYARDLLKRKQLSQIHQLIGSLLSQRKIQSTSLLKRLKKSYYQSEIKNNFGDPKGTWKVLNDLIGRKGNNTEITKLNIISSESSCYRLKKYS